MPNRNRNWREPEFHLLLQSEARNSRVRLNAVTKTEPSNRHYDYNHSSSVVPATSSAIDRTNSMRGFSLQRIRRQSAGLGRHHRSRDNQRTRDSRVRLQLSGRKRPVLPEPPGGSSP